MPRGDKRGSGRGVRDTKVSSRKGWPDRRTRRRKSAGSLSFGIGKEGRRDPQAQSRNA